VVLVVALFCSVLDSLGFPCKQGTHVAHHVKVLSLVQQGGLLFLHYIVLRDVLA
jgi:hypothetical protein